VTTYLSRNDLSSNAKSVSIGVLNARLADSIDLALLTRQAHWNLKGPHFIAPHEMIDGFRTELDGHVDTMAERIVQLGGTALGTTQEVARATSLAPYPTDIYRETSHLDALIERYAQVANTVRADIDETAEAGDADTADLLTAFSRALDKALWFLEAHTQERAYMSGASGYTSDATFYRLALPRPVDRAPTFSDTAVGAGKSGGARPPGSPTRA
jgi:starvation-inducible DNA-binding protein